MNYEEKVEENRNKKHELLKSLGILNTSCDQQYLGSKANRASSNAVTKAKKRNPSVYLQPTRRSNRIQNLEPMKYHAIIDQSEAVHFVKQEKIKRENVFGAIPGIVVGTEFSTRLEASAAGIHRPPVAGIHGDPSLGCYSLALSGGYEDDIDLGDSFIYTGEGGRDLKGTKVNPKNLRTAPQSKDQVLERGNLALSKNIENNVPVRVLRGYKLRSRFAPTEGYRYDGLYNVLEYYTAKGLSGFKVYKFRLERVKDQEPAPWSDDFVKFDNENRNKLKTKQRRLDPLNQLQETVRKRTVMRIKRKILGFRTAKRERSRHRMRLKRLDPEFCLQERERQRERMKVKRSDPEFREREREEQRIRLHVKRLNPAFKEKEKAQNLLRMRLKKQNTKLYANLQFDDMKTCKTYENQSIASDESLGDFCKPCDIPQRFHHNQAVFPEMFPENLNTKLWSLMPD